MADKRTVEIEKKLRELKRLARRDQLFSSLLSMLGTSVGTIVVFIAISNFATDGNLARTLNAAIQGYIEENQSSAIVIGGVVSIVAAALLVTFYRELVSKVFVEPEDFRSSDREDRPVGPEPYVSGITFFGILASDSRSVARSLFSRSGVYLIVGVLFAVLGVVVFFLSRSSLNAPTTVTNDSFAKIEYAVYLVQNAGVLIICELIAFFFLRQSKSILDEFRYFDSIARQREEGVAILRTYKSETGSVDLAALIAAGHLVSRSPRLLAGETTEVLEGRKLEKDEIDQAIKIMQVVAAWRREETKVE